MRIRHRSCAIIALLPALANGGQVALPRSVITSHPGIAPEQLVSIRKRVIETGCPIRRRVPSSNLELAIVLSVEGIGIAKVRIREELRLNFLRNRIDAACWNVIVGKWQT